PVLDRTGLNGSWDFALMWTAKGGHSAADSITLFDAVDKQMGLKLTPEMFPMPFVVVDSVNRNPGDNPPGTAEHLRVAPMGFEVADIKRSGPDSVSPGSPFQRGGRVELRRYTLRKL